MPVLTEAQIRAAKPRDKAYKLFDTCGLYLRVEPGGSRLWRLRYRHSGKEKLLALGQYPYISLKRARERREEARRMLADGEDPSAQRQQARVARAHTFESIAAGWLELQRRKFAAATFVKAEWTFNDLVNPYIGSRPITEITAPELLTVFRRIESRGKHETAHRTKQRCGQVFRYAIATGRADRDPTADLRGALAPSSSEITPRLSSRRKRSRRSSSHPLCSFGPASSAGRSGRSSTWMLKNGGFPQVE